MINYIIISLAVINISHIWLKIIIVLCRRYCSSSKPKHKCLYTQVWGVHFREKILQNLEMGLTWSKLSWKVILKSRDETFLESNFKLNRRKYLQANKRKITHPPPSAFSLPLTPPYLINNKWPKISWQLEKFLV